MTDILEPGSGKSSLYGGTPVIVTDAHNHWLYGWTEYEKAEAEGDHMLLLVSGISLIIYIAYIEARFPQVIPITRGSLVNTSTIRYKDLRAIDQAITLTQRHANELEALQKRYEAGECRDAAGKPILPNPDESLESLRITNPVAARDRTT